MTFPTLGLYVLYISFLFKKEMCFYMLSAGSQNVKFLQHFVLCERVGTCSISGFTNNTDKVLIILFMSVLS